MRKQKGFSGRFEGTITKSGKSLKMIEHQPASEDRKSRLLASRGIKPLLIAGGVLALLSQIPFQTLLRAKLLVSIPVPDKTESATASRAAWL